MHKSEFGENSVSLVIAETSESSLLTDTVTEELLDNTMYVTSRGDGSYITVFESSVGADIVKTTETTNITEDVASLFLSNWNVVDTAGDMYVWPYATNRDQTPLYQLKDAELHKITPSYRALSASPHPNGESALITHNNRTTAGFVSVAIPGTEPIPIYDMRTLAEKCVWTNTVGYVCGVPELTQINGTLPDAWYAGNVSTDDGFWYADTDNNLGQLLYDPILERQLFLDVSMPEASVNGDFVHFVNKKDGTLWLFDVTRSAGPLDTFDYNEFEELLESQ